MCAAEVMRSRPVINMHCERATGSYPPGLLVKLKSLEEQHVLRSQEWDIISSNALTVCSFPTAVAVQQLEYDIMCVFLSKLLKLCLNNVLQQHVSVLSSLPPTTTTISSSSAVLLSPSPKGDLNIACLKIPTVVPYIYSRAALYFEESTQHRLTLPEQNT